MSIRINKKYVFIILLLVLAVFGFRNAGKYLSSPQNLPVPADAMFILGGDAGARTLRGIELYNTKFAQRVILTGLEEGEAGTQKYYLNWRTQALIAGGVAKDRIEFDLVSRNSWEEAANALLMAKARGWRKIIVVSDPPHIRRLHWVWRKTFKGSGAEVILTSGTPKWWIADRWWTNETSAKFVVNEYLKIIYYFVKYSY